MLSLRVSLSSCSNTNQIKADMYCTNLNRILSLMSKYSIVHTSINVIKIKIIILLALCYHDHVRVNAFKSSFIPSLEHKSAP